jgi:hypothetical protein
MKKPKEVITPRWRVFIFRKRPSACRSPSPAAMLTKLAHGLANNAPSGETRHR